ncbi:MAG: 50S ribosomal protein L3 [Candidatus Thermoplasmatota archaeon]|nr:50S ribosomal protein L3 [Candidatus Thermoplasmatota archaeon]
MPKVHRPRRGSMAYSPRKRARREVPHFGSWPEVSGSPRIQSFAGYKAGMTHVLLVDFNPNSPSSGQEIQVPVTVVETPPMKVGAVRFYENGPSGLQARGEVWSSDLDRELGRRRPVGKGKRTAHWDRFDPESLDEVRVLMHTQPRLVPGVPKKAPDVMETQVGGGTVAERLAYAREQLGKEVTVHDFAEEGRLVDVAAVTKAKGFQGAVQRWGIKILSHKDSKIRRRVGTLGTFSPGYTRPTVPQAGQMGYHQRTEYNKLVLKIGDDPAEINPDGGFLRYGEIRNTFLLVKGSVPGPTKRLVRLRDPMRARKPKIVEEPEFAYVSLTSKQGA